MNLTRVKFGRLGEFAVAILCLALCCPRASAQAQPEELLMIRAGTLPIVISAPHGGRKPIAGIDVREGKGIAKFVISRDGGTEELAERLVLAIEKRMSGTPYLVAARFERRFADVNRPALQAYESDGAKPYYEAYHGALQKACDAVRKDWGRGLVLDLHGQAAQADAIFRGTNNGRTTAHLVDRFGRPALVGPDSIFGALAKYGHPIVPANDSTDDEDNRYSGGYIVQTYGSKQGGTLDAIQLELGATLRSAKNRDQTADDIAAAVEIFARAYLPKERVKLDDGKPLK